MKIKTAKIDVILMLLGVAILGLVSAIALKTLPVFATSDSTSEASAEHFVTILDRGTKLTIKTDAATVGEALERAHIELSDSDLVEPSEDTEIITNTYRINIYRARPVVLVDGKKRIKTMTAASEPRAVALSAGLTLHTEDTVHINTSTTFLETGAMSEYIVTRAKLVDFIYYGQPTPMRTQAATVGDFLRDKSITITDDDWLSLDPDTTLTDGITLEIVRQGKTTITVTETIPFVEQAIYSYDYPRGHRAIETTGAAGQKTVTYEIEMLDGREISRQTISELIITPPTAQVVIIGKKSVLPEGDHTQWMRAAGIAEEDFGYVNYIVNRESRWDPYAINKKSGACGLMQFLPCTPDKAGASWSDPVTALKYGQKYALSRYKTWENAYKFWLSHNWW